MFKKILDFKTLQIAFSRFSVLPDSTKNNHPWSYSEVLTIEPGNMSFEAHPHIAIPAEIDGQPVSQGHYHLGVFVTDAAGNEEQAFLELHLEEGHDHDHDHDHDH